jgi:peroxiredoxin
MFRIPLFICILVVAVWWQSALAADAPDFELEDFDGDDYALEDLLEDCDLLVIDFWQVGCKPCNELLPHLQDYYDEYEEQGVMVLIISRDTAPRLAGRAVLQEQWAHIQGAADTELEVSVDYGEGLPQRSSSSRTASWSSTTATSRDKRLRSSKRSRRT